MLLDALEEIEKYHWGPLQIALCLLAGFLAKYEALCGDDRSFQDNGIDTYLGQHGEFVNGLRDLRDSYEVLPPDNRARLEADFPEIGEVLKHNRGTFGRWRYFEQTVGADGMAALVNTRRVRGLGKAARVIVDECVIVGLTFGVDIDTMFDAVLDRESGSFSERISLRLHGGQAAIPWAEALDSGRDES